MAAVLARCGCSVIGQWSSASDALTAALEARPDLFVIGRTLLEQVCAGEGGRSIRAHVPGKIVIVLDPGEELTPQQFVEWDVEGLILSNASISDFVECIVGVRQGRRWLDPDVRGLLGMAERRSVETVDLSAREAEIARMAAAGLTNKKIAQRLAVSDGTVKMHMHHILTKLHLVSRLELPRLFGKDHRIH